MKKRKTTSAYATFALLFTIALLSFSANPPNGRTGAPGEDTCSSCHDSPPAGVQGLLSIEDLPATIMPNTTYTLTVRAKATMGSPSTGGFQLVALDDNDVNIGDLISTSNNTGTNTAGTGREYMEHRGDKNVNNSEEVTWTFDWVAPDTGSGNVNMWASAVLANNNGATSNDRVLLTSTSTPFMGSTPPMISISKMDNYCFGFDDGSATANATEGTPPYSYLWSNNEVTQSITNLTAGSYSVTVNDANALSATASVTINDPSEIILNTSSTAATCGLCNGSSSVNPSGGTPPYSFRWDTNAGNQNTPTAVNLCAGTYLLTITDSNACSKVETLSVFTPETLEISHTTVDNSCVGFCDGIATVLPSGGTSPYTFQWDANANNQTTATVVNLCGGTYSFTVTDNDGCIFQSQVTINPPTPITSTISLTEISTIGLCDATATASANGGTPPYLYQWDSNTGSQTGAMATNLCPGTYNLTISDNTCFSVFSIVIDNISRTLNPILNQSVSLFPNPNNGRFIIEMNGERASQEWQIDLFDLQGKSVRPSQSDRIDQQIEIHTTALADGIYLVRLQNASSIILKKLVISRE